MSLNIHKQDLGNGEQIEESCSSTQKSQKKKITDAVREYEILQVHYRANKLNSKMTLCNYIKSVELEKHFISRSQNSF